jgi:hypothetical protein
MTEREVDRLILDRLVHHLRELRRELNSARREVCELTMPCLGSQKGYAKGRGWNCFNEEDDNA